MMAERGLHLAQTTILRWVRRNTPEFVKRWNIFSRSSGRSWRVDETYIKVRGKWVYLYRAVDKAGHTVDFRLSDRRDVAAAASYLSRRITLFRSGASDPEDAFDNVMIFYAELNMGRASSRASSLPGQPADPTLLKNLSPLGWEHINLTGDYRWKGKRPAPGRFRSLRSPNSS